VNFNITTIIYDDSDEVVVSEVVALDEIVWKPCSKRARQFVLLDGKPTFTKINWKPSLKFAESLDHSLKGYADDVTLISTRLVQKVMVNTCLVPPRRLFPSFCPLYVNKRINRRKSF